MFFFSSKLYNRIRTRIKNMNQSISLGFELGTPNWQQLARHILITKIYLILYLICNIGYNELCMRSLKNKAVHSIIHEFWWISIMKFIKTENIKLRFWNMFRELITNKHTIWVWFFSHLIRILYMYNVGRFPSTI